MSELDEGVIIVEGIVESNPLSGYCTVRTVDPSGKHVSFDVQDHLKSLAGQEVRLVVAPLATYQKVQQAMRQLEAQGEQVVSVDSVDPLEEN